MQVCGFYGLNHDIKYNSMKSAVSVRKGKYMRNVDVPLKQHQWNNSEYIVHGSKNGLL